MTSEEEELIILLRKEVALVRMCNGMKELYDLRQRELRGVQEEINVLRKVMGYDGFGVT
jgi:hypothetical protein